MYKAAQSTASAHEDLTSTMSALLTRIRALRTLAREDDEFAPDLPTLRQGLSELEWLAGQLSASFLGMSGELVLADLPSSSLSEALAQLVEATAEAHTLSSRSIFAGQEQPLSDYLARLLYRLTQEALARVAMHEGARRLRFSLEYQPTGVVMSIEDDGVPGHVELLFEQIPGKTLALPPFLATEQSTNEDVLANTIMHRLRRMLESVGGTLIINSSMEHGTQIQVHVPYIPLEQHKQRLPLDPAKQIQELSPKIRVLIVDSQAVSRAGLRRLLESYPDLEIVGEAADSMQAVSETAELLPQVVLIEAQLPGEQSLETLRRLRQLNATIHVLFLADREREELLYEALRAGASGYILKDIAPDDLAHAVRQAGLGEVLVQPHMTARLLARLGGYERAHQEKLTAREREVLQLLARGLRNKEIATRLTVSERTVSFHLANIYAKLHVSGRTEALSKALERGLLKV